MQDTLVVPVAALSDSLRAVLGPMSGQVADSIRAVLGLFAVHVVDTLRVTSKPEGLSVANGIAGLALAVSGVFSFLLWKLQQAQNQMVARHEIERRELEVQIRAHQTKEMDHRIGGTAFTLERQLRRWLDEPMPHSGGRLVGAVVAEARSATTDEDKLWLLELWARTRCVPKELEPAEERAEALLNNAAAASDSVGPKAVKAFHLFHEAIGHLQKGVIQMQHVDHAAARRSFLTGYDVLRACVERLEELIPEQLQGQLIFLRGIASTLQTYPPTVSVDPAPTPDPPRGA